MGWRSLRKEILLGQFHTQELLPLATTDGVVGAEKKWALGSPCPKPLGLAWAAITVVERDRGPHLIKMGQNLQQTKKVTEKVKESGKQQTNIKRTTKS